MEREREVRRIHTRNYRVNASITLKSDNGIKFAVAINIGEDSSVVARHLRSFDSGWRPVKLIY